MTTSPPPSPYLVLVWMFGHDHRVAAGHQEEKVPDPGGVWGEQQLSGVVDHGQLNVHVTQLVLQAPV